MRIYIFMERLSINRVLMRCALTFAERSTCLRVKAGTVITVDNHIVSTGYNGNAPGQEHCSDHFYKIWEKSDEPWKKYNFEEWTQTDEFKDLHREWSIEHELHGEMNAIIYASRKGIPIVGANIYTTYSPCIFCTKAIIHAGIKRVFYNKLYDRPDGLRSLEILKENGIETIHLKEV